MAISPMMQQYVLIKREYKDCILLYRLGDFYEMFFEDALKASKILDLVLTGRDCGTEERAPMCGVPYHAVNTYIEKLVAVGEKVAICEQITPPGKGIVERKVIRVITQGTLFEDNILDEKSNNYLATVYRSKKALSLAWCDLSTGEFMTAYFDSKKALVELQERLSAITPTEILCNSEAVILNSEFPCIIGGSIPKMRLYTDRFFEFENAQKCVLEQFNVASVEVFGLKDHPECVSVCGALLEYLKETQMRTLPHLEKIKLYNNGEYMSIDYNTRRNLELVQTSREKKRYGSLLWLLDNTSTVMGARMLAKWIAHPLADIDEINVRLHLVELFIDDFLLRQSLIEVLSSIKDIERLCGRLSFGNITPRDYNALGESLKRLPKLKEMLSYTRNRFARQINDDIDEFTDLCELVNSAIAENAPILLNKGDYIKRGFNKELDELAELKNDGTKLLNELESRERDSTGIRTLKVGYNKVFGYYIDVSNSFKDKVPSHYVRKQTLTSGERFVTQELKDLEDKLITASDRYFELERRLFGELRERIMPYIVKLQQSSNAIARLDAIISLASVSVKNGYTKPIMTTNDELVIEEGRHPVIEEYLRSENFISNDTHLDCVQNRTMILTGPNMAGKSTYMRQVALITIMAHIGCFVPAKKAVIPIVDKVFTRVGASDDLLFNQSTFMVEMIESAFILNNATERSLIIIDELGRGTSTSDGLSIAQAVIEHITQTIKAKTIFATHFSELNALEGKIEGIKCYHVSVSETPDGIVFLRKIKKGGSNKSFGIEVAELAGIDKRIINRAKDISRETQSNE